MQDIELLAPAKNMICGKEAILHGADAVYIGAGKFGARSAAGNSLQDIAELVLFARDYHAKVYVTINTLILEEELKEAESLIWDLWRVGVDALIIQDMGILNMNLPPIPLHASTQTDNSTLEKVQFLEQVGFSRVVLARELSIPEIRAVSASTQLELECFIHGALCVSYSGRCFMSQFFSNRSANRGACAQYCRLPYDLVDANNRSIFRQKHLLSLKDLNRTDSLEQLLEAGVRSFKIEGRLKDVHYVKNITAWYHEKLNQIVAKNPTYRRASSGVVELDFEPNVFKSFNRGFTDYFLEKRTENMTNPLTPKSMGEPVGVVSRVGTNSIGVSGKIEFQNGDGIAYQGENGVMDGFGVNRVEGRNLYPNKRLSVALGTPLFRTQDAAFDQQLNRPSSKRFIPVHIVFRDLPFGFCLEMWDDANHRAVISWDSDKVKAMKPQKEQMVRVLEKLGGTLYAATDIQYCTSDNWFVPVSVLTEKRRLLVEKMNAVRRLAFKQSYVNRKMVSSVKYPKSPLTFQDNVANSLAETFYASHGAGLLQKALETSETKLRSGDVLMTTKFCLKYEWGLCPKSFPKGKELQEPLYLVFNNQRVQLTFDCKKCLMQVQIK